MHACRVYGCVPAAAQQCSGNEEIKSATCVSTTDVDLLLCEEKTQFFLLLRIIMCRRRRAYCSSAAAQQQQRQAGSLIIILPSLLDHQQPSSAHKTTTGEQVYHVAGLLMSWCARITSRPTPVVCVRGDTARATSTDVCVLPTLGIDLNAICTTPHKLAVATHHAARAFVFLYQHRDRQRKTITSRNSQQSAGPTTHGSDDPS